MRRRHNPKGIIRYNYFPEFDNWPATIEQAYDHYERNGLCHIVDNGEIRCYQEFGDLEPDEYEIDYLTLVDLI